MAHDSYTLIVVPHAKAKFRQFKVSVRSLRRAGWGAGLLLLAFSGVLIHYAWLSVNLTELRGLRVENEQLRDKTKEYEENAGRLQAKLEQLQRIVNKLGMMAGVEQALPDPEVGGQGGVSSLETQAPSEEPSLVQMDRNVATLTEKSARLEEFYKDQTILLSSTRPCGRCAATSRRDSATGSTRSRARGTSTPASTSRHPGGRKWRRRRTAW